MTLDEVDKAYTFYSKIPSMYKVSSYIQFIGMENYLRKKCVDNLNLKKGDKVLDLACGMGYNFKHLQKAVGPIGMITGLDYVENMLKQAKKLGFHNVQLVKQDAAEMSFPKDHFDGIISTIGFGSIPNHKKALKLAVKNLKPNKRIVILESKLFTGILKVLNPIVKLLRWSKSYDPSKDILKDLGKEVNIIQVNEYLGGLFYIATGIKN